MPATICHQHTLLGQLRLGEKPAIKLRIMICLVLVFVVLAVYVQTGNHSFLTLDDDAYIVSNPHVAGGITGRNIVWAFTTIDFFYWQPMTWLSHMMDVQLYGLNPRGHHLTNVLIHAASALSLLLLLFRTTGNFWQSSFVAFMFALHPLHVESVAWVAERKDVLSAFFCFLSLAAYAEFTVKRQATPYICSLVLFLLGLMSKPMLVTLPIVMLLMDFWPLNRYQHGDRAQGSHQHYFRISDLVKEKLPFLACSLISGIITIYGQVMFGAMTGFADMSLKLRIENALTSYVKYVGKTVWPHDLAVLYPFPVTIPLFQVVTSGAALLLLSAAAFMTARRYPYVVVGWLWFLVTLLPVIGLTQAGVQSMADRFSYIPIIGLFIMTTWGVPDLLSGLRYRHNMLVLVAGLAIIGSVTVTWQQLKYWENTIALYRHTLQVTTDNYLIHHLLGDALADKGERDAAIREYRESIRINPNESDVHVRLGIALQGRGEIDAAITEYRQAIRLNSNDAVAHANMGIALEIKGEPDAAIREYQEAIRLNPNSSDVHFNLGLALAGKGNTDMAIQEYRAAIRVNQNNKKAYNNLGVTLALNGDFIAAIAAQQKVVQLSPGDATAHYNLALSLARVGQLDAASIEFQEVLRINPAYTAARQNLERMRAQKMSAALP